MSRKVDPRSLRTGVTKDWASSWFAEKDVYAKNLLEDDKIRKYLKKALRFAGFDSARIERSIQKITVNINVSKPGIVIGRKGAGLGQIRTDLAKITKSDIDLQVIEVKKPDLSAAILGENLAIQLEKRVHVKRAMNMAVKKAMESGAMGARVEVSGTIQGPNSIANIEKVKDGSIPTLTFRADIDYAKTTAFTRGGTIGVKVWIHKGEIKQ
jgi:small subunit ribosomal protein S3